MKISIHQPNFMPWYPFFEKIEQADRFIILSHCQFEKNNFQNRFFFEDFWQTLSVKKGMDDIVYKQYNNVQYDWQKIKKRLFKYRYILDKFDDCIVDSLFVTNTNIILKICKILDIKTDIVMDYPSSFDKTQRLLELCKFYGASTYLSGPSGKKYLDEKIFTENNINIEYFHSENKCAILGGST